MLVKLCAQTSILDDFPSVSRDQAIQTLELAKEMLVTHA